MFFFFFKQKTAYEMRISDWSSDVCSSDLSVTFVEKNKLFTYPHYARLRVLEKNVECQVLAYNSRRQAYYWSVVLRVRRRLHCYCLLDVLPQQLNFIQDLLQQAVRLSGMLRTA